MLAKGQENVDFSDLDGKEQKNISSSKEEDIKKLRQQSKAELNKYFLLIQKGLEQKEQINPKDDIFEKLESAREKEKSQIEKQTNMDIPDGDDQLTQKRVQELKNKFPNRSIEILKEFAKTEQELNIMIDQAPNDSNFIARMFGRILKFLKTREKKTEK